MKAFAVPEVVTKPQSRVGVRALCLSAIDVCPSLRPGSIMLAMNGSRRPLSGFRVASQVIGAPVRFERRILLEDKASGDASGGMSRMSATQGDLFLMSEAQSLLRQSEILLSQIQDAKDGPTKDNLIAAYTAVITKLPGLATA